MVSQVLGDPRFGYPEVVCEPGTNRFPASRRAAPNQIGDGHPQGLAGLDIVVRRKIRIRQHPNTRPRRRFVRSLQRGRGASKQTAKIHFQLGESRSQSRVAITAARRRECGCVHRALDGRRRRRPFGRLFGYRARDRRSRRSSRPGRSIPGRGMLRNTPGRSGVPSAAPSTPLAVLLNAQRLRGLGTRKRFSGNCLHRFGRQVFGWSSLWNCRWLFRSTNFGSLGSRRERGNFRRFGGAEARCAFLRFRFPVRPPKTLRRRQIPSPRISSVATRFKIAGQLERHHGVACFSEKIGELTRRIFARACAANARGNLFPVSHTVNGF